MIRDETYWLEQRERICLEPGTVYLNTGSYAPLPKCVAEAAGELRREQARTPSDFYWRKMPELLNRARSRLAEFLNVPAAELLLQQNITFAINLVLRSLKFSRDSETEILLTDLEYGAMRFCCEEVARRCGWQLRIAAVPFRAEDPVEIVEAVRTAISPRTRVLFLSHVTSPTGLVLPAEQICRLASERGIVTVVDGAHAPGMIPLDVSRIGADFYAGNCHKWLLAPTGAGFLHVKPSRKRELEPLVTSWGWEYDPAKAEQESGWGGSYWARNLEYQGAQDRCPQMVLPVALDFFESIGACAITERTRQLVLHTRKRIGDLGYPPATPKSEKLSGSMTAFEFPDLDVIRARDWLWNTHRIEAPFTTAAGRCFLRVSTAWFNTPDEIDLLAKAIESIPIADLSNPNE